MRRRLLPFLTIAVLGVSCGGGLAETERRGDRVVAALEAYRSLNGEYPSALAELTPECIAEIPVPTWGMRKWLYNRDADGFWLRVNESPATGDGDAHWFAFLGPKRGWQTGD